MPSDEVNFPPIPSSGNPATHASLPANPGSLGQGSLTSETTARSETTRKRIDAVMDSYGNFDAEMRIGTRQRTEKDEFKLYKMRQQLATIESSLCAEEKYRVEMNKSVRNWMTEEVQKLQEHCDALREDQRIHLQRKFEATRVRIEDLERRAAQDMIDIPADIETRGAVLAGMLRDTVAKFEQEKLRRLKAEERLSTTLADHEAFCATTMAEHRNHRTHNLDDIQAKLEAHIRSHMKHEEKLKAYTVAEIARVRNLCSLEEQERERHDLELAAALKRYIAKLQSSLHVVNSTDF